MTHNEQEDRFDLKEAMDFLANTPNTLRDLLANLPDTWLEFKEEPDAWSPRRVLIHFIHNEQTNWLSRTRVILSDAADRSFAPFQQMPEEAENPPSRTDQLLDLFAQLREENISSMREFGISKEDLDREGEHPALGTVNLKQLISTWVVHDLNHLHQIAKSLAKHYRDEVGPWRKNLAILDL